MSAAEEVAEVTVDGAVGRAVLAEAVGTAMLLIGVVGSGLDGLIAQPGG